MIKRRIIAICLTFIMTISSASIAFADDIISEKENPTVSTTSWNIVEVDQVYTVTRTIDGANVEVMVMDDSGNLLSEAKSNGTFVNVIDYSDPDNPIEVSNKVKNEMGLNNMDLDEILAEDTNSITWGNWISNGTVTFNVAGLSAAAIIATIVATFSGVPAAAFDDLLSLFASFSYQYATVRVRTRYGTDSNYQYSQIEITVWGSNTANGPKYNVYGPVVRTYKKSLNSK